MLGVHPEYQGRQIGEQLLAAVQRWCAEDSASQGLVLDTGNARYLDFYQRHGYREIGEVTLGSGARARPPASWRDAGGDLSVPRTREKSHACQALGVIKPECQEVVGGVRANLDARHPPA